MPAAATVPASASPTPPATRETEAWAQVAAILRAARAKVPADLLADHVARLHGDAGFPVLRAAAEAVQRRLKIVAEEGLRVQERPRGGFRGGYRTKRKREPRPWRTVLQSVEPLAGSCGCPDFRGNSLGLCKHLLAVLADLAQRPRVLQRARLLGRPRQDGPALRWQPVKPLRGDGDWLRQVELSWPAGGARAAGPWAALRRRFTEDSRGTLVLKETHAGDPKARLRLLDELAAASGAAGDPALEAYLADERARLQTALELQALQQRAAAPRAFRRRLYRYQQQGVAAFLATGRLLLADDMGLGKTTQAVAACHLLFQHGRVRRGLLVVPAPLKQQWLREWDACSRVPVAAVDGPPEQRAACYRGTGRGFLLVNYEQLLRDLELAKDWDPDLVLLDEAQRIKNWETRTASTIKQLQPRYRLVLTGTPFENRLLELDSILEWLDRRPLQPLWRLLPFHQLDHQLDGGAGLRDLDVLRQRLQPVLLRRRRQEVLDQLPARADTRIDVPLTVPQRDEHDARLQPIARLLQTAERRPLTQAEFLRLMMLFTEQRIVANGMAQFAFDDVWPGIHKARPEPALLEGLSMPKLAELRLLLQQLAVDQGRKVVVFSQWRRALQLAAWATSAVLGEAGVRCTFFTGAQSVRRRNESLVAFHDDPATRVLFATDAGGVGLNLQRAASCCVHFDLPWNPAVFEQRVGRIWRLGQKSKVDVYSLVGEDCIESRIAGILQTKQAAFTALFDGQSDEVRFEKQGGFLAVARSIAGDGVAAPAGRGAVAAAAAAAEDAAEVDVLQASAPAAAGAAAEAEAPDVGNAPATPALDARAVRSLLAGMSVRARQDGGMVLEADRDSAAVLAEVLRGLAGAIEGAVGGAA